MKLLLLRLSSIRSSFERGRCDHQGKQLLSRRVGGYCNIAFFRGIIGRERIRAVRGCGCSSNPTEPTSHTPRDAGVRAGLSSFLHARPRLRHAFVPDSQRTEGIGIRRRRRPIYQSRQPSTIILQGGLDRGRDSSQAQIPSMVMLLLGRSGRGQ